MKNSTAAILPTPTELAAWLDRFVIGQTAAKRDLATAVYGHYLGRAALELDPESTLGLTRENVLVMGPTGCGKTLMVRMLAKLLDIPVSFGVATRFSETGYVGDGVESLIASLISRADGDIDRARRGIVFVDEIDKIARRETRGRDVSGEGVQHGLLSLIEGTRITMKMDGQEVDMDTSELLFIGTGAFNGLPAIVAERLRRQGGSRLGFGADAVAPEDFGNDVLLRSVETEDLIRFGFIPEFIGRFATVTHVQQLDATNLESILVDSEISPLRQQAALFDLHGIRLRFTGPALKMVVEEALALGTGARGLSRVLLRHLADLRFHLPEMQRDRIREVVIGSKTIRGLKAPRLSRGSGRPRITVSSQALRHQAFRTTAVADDGVRRNNACNPITDASDWSDDQVSHVLEDVKHQLGFKDLAPRAALWWKRLELRYKDRRRELLRVVEELLRREATLEEFFVACTYSGTANMMANLHYLDYYRLKRQEAGARRRDDESDDPELP
ncbi:MAG: AAA family ATPase [Planctomycetes bacterium]|nr:AAA family ATPase [Planctomycetota bacterium]